MFDEFDNKKSNEFGQVNENASPDEVMSFNGNVEASELNEVEQDSKPIVKKKKKRFSLNSVMASLVASVGAVAVIAGGVLIPGSSADAQILSTRITDSAIYCEIDVAETDEELYLVVSNDFTRREHLITSGINTVSVTGLKPDISYTVSIEGNSLFGSNKIVETTVRTLSTDKMPVLYEVWHECTCNVDGLFHFTMDFSDQNAYWSDFTASLIDEDGNTAICHFTEDLKGEQTIDVIGNELIGNVAYFEIRCKSTALSAEVEFFTLYSTNVTI